jgi:hypothetical protein
MNLTISPSTLYKPIHGGYLPKNTINIVTFYRTSPLFNGEDNPFTKEWLTKFDMLDPEECFDASSLVDDEDELGYVNRPIQSDCNCIDCGGTENFHSPNCSAMIDIARGAEEMREELLKEEYPEHYSGFDLASIQPLSRTPYDSQKSSICRRCNIYRVAGVCEECGSTC